MHEWAVIIILNLMFIQSLLCATHYSKCFAYTHLILKTTLGGKYYYHPYLTHELSQDLSLNNLKLRA